MEYLIQCTDRSRAYCVILETSIIFESEGDLLPGDSIKFLWPENKKKQKIYKAVILEKSRK